VTRDPRFRELVGDDLTPEEAERLGRVHDLLVEAGPLPELPRSLETPRTDVRRGRPVREHAGMFELLPRRRLGAALALAAAIAMVAFLGGYVAGYRNDNGPTRQFVAVDRVTLRGTAQARRALAVVTVGRKDANGNLPMVLSVHGLKPLPPDGYYTLALLKNGRPVVTCGTFRVRTADARTIIPMTVAYDVDEFDGWVVTQYRHGRNAQPVVLRS
jgi:hypothetical protein